jgi:hypothetical protein
MVAHRTGKYILVQLLPWCQHLYRHGGLQSRRARTNQVRKTGGKDERTLHSEDDAAIRFLLGSFISIDIISVLQLGRVLSWN